MKEFRLARHSVHSQVIRFRGSSETPNLRMRKDHTMPEKETIERARRDKRQGKSPTTQGPGPATRPTPAARGQGGERRAQA